MTQHRIAAALLVVSLLAANLLGGVVPADARPVTGNVGNLDPGTLSCASASLEIRKPVHAPYDSAATGTIPAGVISGIIFDIRRVEGIDLRTPGGWQEVRALDVAEAAARSLGPALEAVTDDSGVARWENVEPGVYLVHEHVLVHPPEQYHHAADLLVTVPTGNAGGADWLCDVRIVAKEVPVEVPGEVGDSARRHLARTGFDAAWLLAGAFLTLGAGVMLAGVRRKARR